MKKQKHQGQVIGTGERIFNVAMVILGILISLIVLYPNILCINSFFKQALVCGKRFCYVFYKRGYTGELPPGIS